MKCYEKDGFAIIDGSKAKIIFPLKSFATFQMGDNPGIGTGFCDIGARRTKKNPLKFICAITTIKQRFVFEVEKDETSILFDFLVEQCSKAETLTNQEMFKGLAEKFLNKMMPPGISGLSQLIIKPSDEEPSPFDDLGDTTLDN